MSFFDISSNSRSFGEERSDPLTIFAILMSQGVIQWNNPVLMTAGVLQSFFDCYKLLRLCFHQTVY